MKKDLPRTRIINSIISKYNYKKYLEIGVWKTDRHFDKIVAEYKIGADPGYEGISEATHTMTSDEFFEQNNEMFDIIFVDGLHESKQVYTDIINSLKFLNEGGTIVCHDMNPIKEQHQIVPDPRKVCPRKGKLTGTWNGDCWKAFVQLRMERDDLEMYAIDTDHGLGIIRRGSREKLEEVELTYDNFDKNRVEWLNLISENELPGER